MDGYGGGEHVKTELPPVSMQTAPKPRPPALHHLYPSQVGRTHDRLSRNPGEISASDLRGERESLRDEKQEAAERRDERRETGSEPRQRQGDRQRCQIKGQKGGLRRKGRGGEEERSRRSWREGLRGERGWRS